MKHEKEKLSRAAFEFDDENTYQPQDDEEIVEEPEPPQLLDESREAAEKTAKIMRLQGITGGLIFGVIIGAVLAGMLVLLRYVAKTFLYKEILLFNTWRMFLYCVLGSVAFMLIVAFTTKPTPEEHMQRAKEYNAEILAKYEEDKRRYEEWKRKHSGTQKSGSAKKGKGKK